MEVKLCLEPNRYFLLIISEVFACTTVKNLSLSTKFHIFSLVLNFFIGIIFITDSLKTLLFCLNFKKAKSFLPPRGYKNNTQLFLYDQINWVNSRDRHLVTTGYKTQKYLYKSKLEKKEDSVLCIMHNKGPRNKNIRVKLFI